MCPTGQHVSPQGLTAATHLAPKCVLPCPFELRRGDLRQQTPRAARTVLTAPFAVDPLQRPPAYMADVSPTQSRWTGREPPARSRNVSGAADTSGPGECASHPGLDDEALARQEAGWNPYPRERRPPTAFAGMCLIFPPLLLARRWVPLLLILPKSTARATS